MSALWLLPTVAIALATLALARIARAVCAEGALVQESARRVAAVGEDLVALAAHAHGQVATVAQATQRYTSRHG